MQPNVLLRISLCLATLCAAACKSSAKHTDKLDGGHPDASMRDGGHTGTSNHDAGQTDAASHDSPVTRVPGPLPELDPSTLRKGSFCALPGSLVATDNGMAVVPGGDASLADLSFITVPVGFCVHHFANVAETRQLRMSPSGDLFVASPSMPTAGGESQLGRAEIVVLPDDDHDGVADSILTFLGDLPATQGLTFASGYLYFQDQTALKRVAFRPGDRAPSAEVETVTTMQASDAQQFPLHWPKLVDVARDGTIYFTNGSDQGELCYSPGERAKRPPTGVVFKVAPDGSLSIVAKGFRNPIALRCQKDNDTCLVAELARDGSGAQGGREKLVPLRQGDDWGFPCCATDHTPYAEQEFQDPDPKFSGQLLQASDCASVTPERVSFEIGDTPFGIDFEGADWPAPWGKRAFVALHGAVASFIGSRVVALALDPATGLPLATSDLRGTPSSAPNMLDFVRGWDDRTTLHGRATVVTFGDDGRLYVGDDTKGEIFWVAPVTLMQPS
jgi:glucose/arabinose dehydrogenase